MAAHEGFPFFSLKKIPYPYNVDERGKKSRNAWCGSTIRQLPKTVTGDD